MQTNIINTCEVVFALKLLFHDTTVLIMRINMLAK